MKLRRAFSLVEALVAVAAIAVIGAALATVFQSVGDTVTGGRELSRFNALATRIEQQMRADIEAMSRDGFLLIRHVSVGATEADPRGTSDNADVYPVFLAADDPEPRARRADELLFFANGRFETARPPVTESLPNASSSTARIYYGHGVRLPDRWRYPRNVDGSLGAPPVEVTDDRFVGDPFAAGGGPDSDPELRLGGSRAPNVPVGERGPNEFAADWTLLRHAALLVEPSGSYVPPASAPTIEILSETVGRGAAVDRLADSNYQIGGQVAAFTPFRTLQYAVDATPLSGIDPLDPNNNVRGSVVTGAYADFPGTPVVSSGLVDVLIGSLNGRYTGVRDVVTRLRAAPGGAPWDPKDALGAFPAEGLATWLPRFDEQITIGDAVAREDALIAQQLWMLDALPHAGPPRDFATANTDTQLIARMRYDDLAPGWREQLWELQTATGPPGQAAASAAVRFADQQMLGASIFVPRCTEFIVEWSFGERVADVQNPRFGQLVWHGLPRYEDVDRDGQASDGGAGDPEYVVLPYPRVPALVGTDVANGEQDGDLATVSVAFDDGSGAPATWEYSQRLFHGPALANFAVEAGPTSAAAPAFDADVGVEYGGGIELISAFGYFDPTYGVPYDAAIGAPETQAQPAVEWPWPKLLRVTVRLAAENDPLNERTFQFVFEVPEKSTL